MLPVTSVIAGPQSLTAEPVGQPRNLALVALCNQPRRLVGVNPQRPATADDRDLRHPSEHEVFYGRPRAFGGLNQSLEFAGGGLENSGFNVQVALLEDSFPLVESLCWVLLFTSPVIDGCVIVRAKQNEVVQFVDFAKRKLRVVTSAARARSVDVTDLTKALLGCEDRS